MPPYGSEYQLTKETLMNRLKQWLWNAPHMWAWDEHGSNITGPMIRRNSGIVRLALARWVLK